MSPEAPAAEPSQPATKQQAAAEVQAYDCSGQEASLTAAGRRQGHLLPNPSSALPPRVDLPVSSGRRRRCPGSIGLKCRRSTLDFLQPCEAAAHISEPGNRLIELSGARRVPREESVQPTL